MNAQATQPGKGQQNEQSATIGVGHATSGEQGSTLTHETMAETGGSGTRPQPDEEASMSPAARQSGTAGSRQGTPPEDGAEGAGTAATAINRGYQDTRSRQASPGSTGLGAPETGGNQDEDDLAPPRP